MTARILGMPFRGVAALRSARVFHPNGVGFTGTLERLLPEQDGLPLRSGEVSVRVSKGVGLPRGLPDVAGFAVRIPSSDDREPPWDLLFAGSATGPVGRMVPWPSSSWNDAHLSSLMPLKFEGRMWWLRARLSGPILHGMDVADVRDVVVRDRVSFQLEHACGAGPFEPIAVVHSTALLESDRDTAAFDPVLNSPAKVRPQPEWLRNLRLSAYRNSREGRGAGRTDTLDVERPISLR